MKLLPTHKCTPEQFEVIALVEQVLNSVDFKGFIWRTKFTELGDLQGCTGQELYNKFFLNDEYRFRWKIVPRPWYKRLSSVVGYTIKDSIFTYHPRYKSMDYPAQRALLLQQGANVLRQLDTYNQRSPAGDAEARLEAAIAGRRADTARQSSPLGLEGDETIPDQGQTSLASSDDEVEARLAARRRERQGKSAGFCPQCGSPIQKSDQFCPKCGRKLT